MLTALLILLSWPLVMTSIFTFALRQRLRSPVVYFALGLVACVALEILLATGALPVVAGWDLFGMLFKLLIGAGVLRVLFRIQKKDDV